MQNQGEADVLSGWQICDREAASARPTRFTSTLSQILPLSGFAGADVSLCSVRYLQLVKDVGDVGTNRLRAQVEPLECMPCGIPLA